MTTGAYESLRRVAAERIEELRLDPLEDSEEVRQAVSGLVDRYQSRARGGNGLRPLRDPAELTRRLINSLTGYGPLTELLERTDIEEIFIEGPRVTYIDASGRLQALNAPTSEDENRQIIDRILTTHQSPSRHFQSDRTGSRPRRPSAPHCGYSAGLPTTCR